MNFIQSNLEVRQALAKLSGTEAEDWFLCLRGRYGLAAIYSALRKIKGYGEVLTNSYTSITSVNPILYAGLKPIYVDIEPELYSFNNINDALINPNTRAIVIQHTFGIIADKKSVCASARNHGLLLVENSAHCPTRMLRDKNGKIQADISMHSFGSEKILTGTKFGAAIYVNPNLKKRDTELYNEIISRLLQLKHPSKAQELKLVSSRAIQKISDSPKLRNSLTKASLYAAPINAKEQNGEQAEPLASTTFVNKEIIKNLPTLKRNYERRLNNIKLYHKNLSSNHFEQLCKVEEPLLAYPITFESIARANAAHDLLTSSGFFIRRWYSPLLYPGPKNHQRYRYNPKDTPIAEAMSLRTLELPTDLPTRETQKIIKLINGVKYHQDKYIS